MNGMWLRSLALYAGACLVVLLESAASGGVTPAKFLEHCAMAGIGGLFAALFLTRFGLGHTDEAPRVDDEEAVARRSGRRSWLIAALVAAAALLLTAALYPLVLPS